MIVAMHELKIILCPTNLPDILFIVLN